MVVAHQCEHAAARRGAREIGVAEDVAAAVDARSLAVPEPEHAVETALASHLRLLRAPDRGGREFLVEAGLEMDVVGLEQVLQPRELQIEAADRRAAVAGDEAAGIEPSAAVALLLRDQQPRDRLRARQQHRRLRQVETVGQPDLGESRRKGRIGFIVHVPLPANRRRASKGPSRPRLRLDTRRLGRNVL